MGDEQQPHDPRIAMRVSEYEAMKWLNSLSSPEENPAVIRWQEEAAKAFLESRGWTVTKTETAAQARARAQARKWGF